MFNDPALTLGLIVYRGMFARFERLRREEGGASVLEWALIAAVVVLAASIIGAAIMGIVNKKKGEMCDNAGGGC
ncbi:hypothetical protein D9V37_17220 [Nocardioides mangrovicus]|uniref:Flp family type IVb pilin n=1 Tax=Nocardioides mangrovicus TaxID=2478913 RepID=A0A3L8P0G0_9ACTN|nr:hypothetical protein [Nocardioides mangrovicus]RLV47858.1 hypothetical protein D9V37_17220 [Nocardioides mangrovicus]